MEPRPGARVLPEFYVRLAQALLDQLGIQRVQWLGTSMGGSIGLVAAATLLRGRIRAWCSTTTGRSSRRRRSRASAATRGSPAAFATVSELEAYFRTVYQPYGS